MPAAEDGHTARLMLRLRALASPVRLQLLKALVTPSRAADLRIRAAGERAGLDAERFLGRTTLIEHLDVLAEAGLVRKIGETYATDQQAVVALLQDLGDLARLRALVEVDVEVTRPAPAPLLQALPRLPRVLVANGPAGGRAFGLEGKGPWRVGRGAECEVPLVHDPHVSRVHVSIERDGGGFLARVAPSAKNPVLVDFTQVVPGGSVRMPAGALLSVGATLLVLQA